MKLRHFSISQQGDSHIKAGTNCQDHSDTISVINNKLNIEFGIAAIADGVGSCDYSEIGSQIAVSSVLEYLKQELVLLENISENAVVSILKKAFQQANENIECEADKRELPFLLFDTTLTVTILTDAGICYVGHIGDDGVVALMADGSYSMITSRIEGEEANRILANKPYVSPQKESSALFGRSTKPFPVTDGCIEVAKQVFGGAFCESDQTLLMPCSLPKVTLFQISSNATEDVMGAIRAYIIAFLCSSGPP